MGDFLAGYECLDFPLSGPEWFRQLLPMCQEPIQQTHPNRNRAGGMRAEFEICLKHRRNLMARAKSILSGYISYSKL